MRRRLARGAQITQHLDLDILPKESVGDLGQLGWGALTARLGGGVDKNIQPAEFAHGFGDERPDGGVISRVGNDADDPAPGLMGEGARGGLELARAARGDHQIDALPAKLAGDGQTDTLAAAGDERAFALELEIHRPVPSRRNRTFKV